MTLAEAIPSVMDPAELQPARAGPIARSAIVLVLAAQVIRTLASEAAQTRRAGYAVLLAAFLILFFLIRWQSRLPRPLLHGYLGLQSSLVVLMLALGPDLDSVTAFFVPLAFQAALLFTGSALWIWVGILLFLTGAPLAFFHGLPEGLAFAMSPMAFVVAVPALMVAIHEAEIGRRRSQVLLEELQGTHRKLQDHAGQVEELASLQERSRLARELHDTVSQLVFTIVLTARSAQLLLHQDPARVTGELEHLREISGSALSQLRSLISHMRL